MSVHDFDRYSQPPRRSPEQDLARVVNLLEKQLQQSQKSDHHIDVLGVRMSIVTVVSVVAAVSFAVVTVMQERSAVYERLNTMSASIESLATAISNLSETIYIRTNERWTRSNMQMWCRDTERQNPGYKCVNPNEADYPPTPSAPPPAFRGRAP